MTIQIAKTTTMLLLLKFNIDVKKGEKTVSLIHHLMCGRRLKRPLQKNEFTLVCPDIRLKADLRINMVTNNTKGDKTIRLRVKQTTPCYLY